MTHATATALRWFDTWKLLLSHTKALKSSSARLQRVLRLGLCLCLPASVPLVAQGLATPLGPAAPRFEVASVRLSVEEGVTFSKREHDRLTIANMPLRMIIREAYELKVELLDTMLVGGPEKLLDSRFDVQAKVPEGFPDTQSSLPMLKTLLSERFGLRMHAETRHMPIYELRTVRAGVLGPELHRSEIDCAAYRMAVFEHRKSADPPEHPHDAEGQPLCGSGARDPRYPGQWVVREARPLANLVDALQVFVDRPVIDATRLSGNFEWHLAFYPGQSGQGPSIVEAIRDQLGLALERKTGPFEVLVIDAIHTATPN